MGPACSSSTACSASTCAWATAPRPRSSATATSCSRSPHAPTTCSSATSTWHALVPARLALLDDAFAERVKPWPQISHALLARACARAADLDVQRAITSQPRLEVRLTLLLWHLAGRWGRVEPGGIRLALPLTHRLLGRLVGAERPSVSHALSRLAQAGLVTSRDGALHLHGTADEHLAALADRPSARRESEARRRRGRRVRQDGRLHRQRPGRRAHDRPRALADQRTQLRRGVGLADGRDQPEPRGAAARRDPRTAAHRALQPAARLRRRRRLPDARGTPPRAASSIRSCSSSRARSRTRRSTARGTGAGFGVDARGPADHGQHVDRQARAARRRRDGARHLRGLRRGACDAQQPDGRDGTARPPRPRLRLAARRRR